MTTLEALAQAWLAVIAIAGGVGVVAAALGRLSSPWSEIRNKVDKHESILCKPVDETTMPLPVRVMALERRHQEHLDAHAAEAATLRGKLDDIAAGVRRLEGGA